MGGFDKLVHFCMFFTWAVAVRLDFSPEFKWPRAFLAGVVFTVLTEVLQLFAEERSFDYFDMLADTIGLFAGLWSGEMVLKIVLKFWPFRLLKR